MTESFFQCAKCTNIYVASFFACDKHKRSGRQSYCRRCKAEWEQSPENSWKRLRSKLEKEEPNSLGGSNGWTEKLYLERWAESKGLCHWCGAGLREWQNGGHALDRIDNNTPHIPANCNLICWVCNRIKSDNIWQTARAKVDMYVGIHGRGRVPWQTIEKRVKRVELPDGTPYLVKPQLTMFD